MTYNSLQRHCHCVFRPVQPYKHYYHIRHIRNQYMNESLFKLNLIWLIQRRTARRGTQTHTHILRHESQKQKKTKMPFKNDAQRPSGEMALHWPVFAYLNAKSNSERNHKCKCAQFLIKKEEAEPNVVSWTHFFPLPREFACTIFVETWWVEAGTKSEYDTTVQKNAKSFISLDGFIPNFVSLVRRAKNWRVNRDMKWKKLIRMIFFKLVQPPLHNILILMMKFQKVRN